MRIRRKKLKLMLDIPPEWNEVKDVILEDGNLLSENMRP